MPKPKEFKIMREDGCVVECNGCGSDAPLRDFSHLLRPFEIERGAPRLLCEYCASTPGWEKDCKEAPIIRAQNAAFNVLEKRLIQYLKDNIPGAHWLPKSIEDK